MNGIVKVRFTLLRNDKITLALAFGAPRAAKHAMPQRAEPALITCHDYTIRARLQKSSHIVAGTGESSRRTAI